MLSISRSFLFRFPNSMFFFSITPFSLSIYWERTDNFFSVSVKRWLTLPRSLSLLWSSSFSLQVIFNSLLSLPICEAESLKFYWAFLTSSPSWLFSFISFWILILYVSDSSFEAWNLPLKSWSSWLSFVVWAAESLKFSWAPWISPPNALISLFFLSITPLSLSSYWDNKAILFSYSDILFVASVPNSWSLRWSSSFSLQVIFSSLVSLPIWEADNLKFYWAFLI